MGIGTLRRHYPENQPEPEPEPVDATEAARALAEAEGVALAEVEGTGEDGRVVKADVEAALAAREG